MEVSVRIEIFKEGDCYVALAPNLNVSSFGETPEEAIRSVQEAISAFFEECQEMGTLEEIMEESGFLKTDNLYS